MTKAQAISAYMKKIGATGGAVSSDAKREANKRNADKRWAAYRAKKKKAA